jgi:hypothetical protein
MGLKSSHWSCLKAWFKGYTFCLTTFLVRPSTGAQQNHDEPQKRSNHLERSKFRQQVQSFVCVPPWRCVTFKSTPGWEPNTVMRVLACRFLFPVSFLKLYLLMKYFFYVLGYCIQRVLLQKHCCNEILKISMWFVVQMIRTRISSSLGWEE